MPRIPLFLSLISLRPLISFQRMLFVLRKFGVPERIFSVIMSFNHGMMASVRYSGEVSDLFIVFNGTKQGCILVTLICSIFFCNTWKQHLIMFRFQFRTSCGLFNQQLFDYTNCLLPALCRRLRS